MEQCRFARPRRADDPDQFALLHAEAHAVEGRHRRLRPVDLGDRVELEYGTHEAGTTTRWPATTVVSVSWTRPWASLNSPRPTATSLWLAPASTVSTAQPPAAS